MTEKTTLDVAHAAMSEAPDDASARLRFYGHLANTELFVLLGEEPRGQDLSPEIFEVAAGRFVLAFDREERLTQFTGRPAPYAAMPGRVLAAMLAGRGIGLGINPDVATSSILLPADAVDWLHDTLARQAPDRVDARVSEQLSPPDLPEALLNVLENRLSTAGGLAGSAWLAGVGRDDGGHDDGGHGHVLGIIDAVPGTETALARDMAEAMTFSGIDAGLLDVVFCSSSDPMAAKLAAVGLRFEMPRAAPPQPAPRAAPGRDPDKPPILR